MENHERVICESEIVFFYSKELQKRRGNPMGFYGKKTTNGEDKLQRAAGFV